MKQVVVKFRDGTERKYVPEGFGSAEITIRYESGVVILIDRYGYQTVFPLDTVASIEAHPEPGTRW